MAGDANLFDDRFLADLNAALDAVVADDTRRRSCSPAPASTSPTGSISSSSVGLKDRSCMAVHPRRPTARRARADVSRADRCASVNGHAFGIAAMLAVAHDVRVMRCRPGLALPPRDRPRSPVPAVHDRAAPRPAHRPHRRRKQCSPVGATPEMRRSRPASPTKPSSSRRCSSARSRSRPHAAARAAKSPRRSSGICTHRCCPHSREAGGRIGGELDPRPQPSSWVSPAPSGPGHVASTRERAAASLARPTTSTSSSRRRASASRSARSSEINARPPESATARAHVRICSSVSAVSVGAQHEAVGIVRPQPAVLERYVSTCCASR